MHGLAESYHSVGRYSDAEELLARARAMYDRMPKAGFSYYTDILNTQTQVYACLEKWNEAEKASDTAFRLWDRRNFNESLGLNWNQLKEKNNHNFTMWAAMSLVMHHGNDPNKYAEWALNLKAAKLSRYVH